MLCQIIAPQKQVAHLASLSFAIVFATSAFPSVSLRKIWQFYVNSSNYVAIMRYMRIQAKGL